MKFMYQYSKNISRFQKRMDIYNKINPILFDVSLRDGIQNAKIEDYSTENKKYIFDTIVNKYHPRKIEVGSLTSPKILPIMGDSLTMYNYAITNNNQTDIFLLIPSISKLDTALQNNVNNMSFITSVSDKFQIRNTKKSIEDTKKDFENIFKTLSYQPFRVFNTKLYISCINTCPIIGKIDNDFIVKEIIYYHQKYPFDELCLSDTMGNLQYDDIEYILSSSLFFGVPASKFSFHFHYSKDNLENLERIFFYLFRNKINKFDVSMTDSGGCSVTMKSENLRPNLSYDMFFSILEKFVGREIRLSEP